MSVSTQHKFTDMVKLSYSAIPVNILVHSSLHWSRTDWNYRVNYHVLTRIVSWHTLSHKLLKWVKVELVSSGKVPLDWPHSCRPCSTAHQAKDHLNARISFFTSIVHIFSFSYFQRKHILQLLRTKGSLGRRKGFCIWRNASSRVKNSVILDFIFTLEQLENRGKIKWALEQNIWSFRQF